MSINPPARVYRKVDPAGLRSAEVVDVDTVTTVDETDAPIEAPPLPVAEPDDELVEAIQFDGENHGDVLAAAVGEVVRGGVQLTDAVGEPAPHISVEDRTGTIHELAPGDYLVVHDPVADVGTPLEVKKPDEFAANFEEVQRP